VEQLTLPLYCCGVVGQLFVDMDMRGARDSGLGPCTDVDCVIEDCPAAGSRVLYGGPIDDNLTLLEPVTGD
jgi:hypothetical protein